VCATSFHRYYSQNPIVVTSWRSSSIAIRRRKIDVPIRTLGNVPNSTVLTFQQIFLAQNLTPVKRDANYSSSNQTTKKEIVFELRKLCAAIKHSARRRAGRCVL